jgi:murein L,D-transpeptidase YcbB/YkuD
MPTEQAASILEVLQGAESKGLDPEDYEGSRWADRLAGLRNAGQIPPESDLSRFDLAVTLSLIRYVSDLHFGKANPGLFRKGFDLETEPNDVAAFIRQRIVNGTTLKSALEEVEPPFDGYRRTLHALQHYLSITADGDLGSLPFPKVPVKPGDAYPAAGQLATMLHRLGDLPEGALPAREVYDGPLVDAVKHFQERHGLDTDGVLGKATFTQINTPLSRRIRQLRLTLERWRWMPHRFARPPIVVNIPEFELRALDASYRIELEMAVVVGANSVGHRTPIFAEMQYVTFRPYWRVPLSIQRAELVPKLEKDQSYLVKNGYQVITLEDKVISDGEVNEDILKQLRSGELLLRQRPGPENALGLVAFSFPNDYDVFLHDTPATELFAKTRRDFSHGCIRAEKPGQLANWVLRDMPEWTPERIASTMHEETNDGKPIQVRLANPIPVLIVYATAVVLESGEVRFFEDIYKQDAQLEQLLASGYRYREGKATSAARGPRPHE